MGEKKHEAPRLREARANSPGRAIAPAGPANPADSGHSPVDPSIAGTIAIDQAGPRRSKTSRLGPIASGTRIPDEVRERIVAMALDLPELSPRELATRFTDTDGYFVSESSVYRLLKAHDLITSPAFIVIKGGGRVQGQDDGPQPALADRLHLSQGHRLGLVLSVNHPRRLLTLHHRLEVVHDHAGRRRNRHPATRPHGIWVCCSARRPQTAIA